MELDETAKALIPTLITWLNTPTFREKRLFLLEHLELLQPECDQLFAVLSQQYGGDPGAVNNLRVHHMLLHDARRRGGTPPAIDEAFVNSQGGLTLALPDWLEAIVKHADELDTQGTPEQTAKERVALWRDALARAAQEPDGPVPTDLAPEIVAEMNVQLYSALYFDSNADPMMVQQLGSTALEGALTVYTRERYPIQWAATMSNLGILIEEHFQGDRAANVERAIACFNQALQIFTADAFPMQWAMTQNSLGDTYRVSPLGVRADNLESAIACFTSALRVYTPDHYPAQWANTQNLLGITYVDRIRGDHAENIEQALRCYSAALQIYTQQNTPVAWAMVVNNLGIAYKSRVHADQSESLENAIACYVNALLVRTREQFPVDWAVTQNNLGNAYIDRIQGDQAENIEQAIACFTAALEVRTKDASPKQWALTTDNLGKAYLARLRGNKADNVEQAIACFNEALQVYRRDDFPTDWADTQNLLGNAYGERLRGNRAENLEKAIAYYQSALEISTRDAAPLDWARTLANLAGVYRQRVQGDKGENVEQAIACYTNVLQIMTRDALPRDWASTQNNLGSAYFERVRGDHAENIEQAIVHYQAALEIYTRDASPTDWALTQNNLGNAYSSRIRGDRSDNLERAFAALTATLQVYARETFPADWATSYMNLGRISLDRIQGDHAENIEFALQCFANTLQIATPHDYPILWAMTKINQGNAYHNRIRGNLAENVEQAIACYSDAEQVYTHDGFPSDWALAENNLGNAYADRLRGDHAENIEQSIAHYVASLEVRTLAAAPIDWAATQLNLGSAFAARIRGDQAENQERAIAYYEAALQVYTRESLPMEWAMVQNNLGTAYSARIRGEHGENLERAIRYYIATLEVYTRDGAPIDWARMQNNLSDAFYNRMRGDRAENLEQAIDCAQSATDVYTHDAFPAEWALAQSNLGKAYRERIAGDRTANFAAALDCYHHALEVYTREDMPRDWARLQTALGATYREYPTGDRAANLERAAAYYTASLAVYTRDADPTSYRLVKLNLAEIAAERGDWAAAHRVYQEASEAEQFLLALAGGARGRDAILQEGRDAGVRDSFVLAQLGRLEEAVVAVEQSRARALAEARALDAADPDRIGDPARRARYLEARQCLIDTQAELNRPLPDNLTEEEQRQADIARIDAFHQARVDFDATVSEIRAANDPAGFLHDDLTIDMIWQALAPLTSSHALAYLIATPWGGKALMAVKDGPSGAAHRCVALDLPDLTYDFVADLIQIELQDRSRRVIGGFGHAQEGRGFSFISHIWPGASFAEKVANLKAACATTGQQSTLVSAAEEILQYPAIAALANAPLTDAEYKQIDPTLSFAYLQHELRRCLPALAQAAMGKLASGLSDLGATGTTIVPCGALAAFPLLAALIDGETAFADVLPASLAPSARSLSHAAAPNVSREGVYALGDPWPTHQKLEWGEAEAQSIARLAGRSGAAGDATHVVTHEAATRDWLLAALRRALVIDACCHGEFDSTDFLRSRLLLANNEKLTLADLLNGETTSLQGLRLLILSACQTAILDLRGARDEVRSLAAGMLQGGAQAVLGALWSVDDRATYLLMVRFAQEWFPHLDREPPAAALARAQRWLRTVTYNELRTWSIPSSSALSAVSQEALAPVRGGGTRYASAEAVERVTATAEFQDGSTQPYTDPIYWSAFQLTGW